MVIVENFSQKYENNLDRQEIMCIYSCVFDNFLEGLGTRIKFAYAERINYELNINLLEFHNEFIHF